MKILIVSQYYYPEQFLINEIAPELVNRGHSVTVLTGLPNYPEGIVLNDYKFGRKRNETINGVHILRCFEIGRGHGKISLILNYLSFAISGHFKAMHLKEKFDVVLCYQLSPITMAFPALAVSKKQHIPLVLYCLDIWPESAKAHVKNDDGLIYRRIASMSKSIYQKCDKLLVTSKPFIGYFKKNLDIPEEKISYLPQHSDGRYLDKDLSSNSNGIIDFMFAGNLGYGQSLDVIINAVAKLKNRNDFKVHFVGDGSCMEQLKQLSSKLRVDDLIVFHGRIPYSDMEAMYKISDALLITLRGDNEVGKTLPGKLQTYLTVGKPVFGAINGAANDLINEAHCGVCTGAGDSEGLASIMLDFILHPEKYERCGINARRFFAENFTIDHYINGLERELQACLESRR